MKSPFELLSEYPLRLPRLRPYVPSPDDPAIFWFNSERKDIVREVVDRVVRGHGGGGGPGADGRRLELMLNDTALNEVRRLERQRV
ncbi:MAG TPA: hypothetical protein RMH26_19155, partial [Polyangiaceae bacterium LLY-WYZ-15_(1-7)]|nr:hypothetical protein [Polyangiaceae bacterium LLY-WYZ-15_(1-7)]